MRSNNGTELSFIHERCSYTLRCLHARFTCCHLVEHKAQKFFFPTHPHLTYIMRAPCTCMHFTFIMSTLLFPDAFLPRNHEHFMNWKTEKRHFEERAAPWAGLETWSAIAVDQNTASRTKRGEPNLWTHFGKRVRMLACSIRCFEHLVVSNRSGLLSMISSCCLVTTCINLEYYSESWRTPPAFSLAPQYLQGSSWRAASFGTRSSGRLGWNGRWAWLGEDFFFQDVHTLWEILGLVLGAHLGEVLSFSNEFCTFAFSVAAALRFIAATSQHQSVWSHFWGSNSYLYSAKLSCDDRPWRPSEKTPWNEDAPYENGLFYALPSLRSMYCFVFLFVLNWVSTCVKCDSWFAAIHTQVQERPTTVSHGHRIVNYNVRVSPENFPRIVHQTSSVSAKNDCYRKQTRRAYMHPCIPSHPIRSYLFSTSFPFRWSPW